MSRAGLMHMLATVLITAIAAAATSVAIRAQTSDDINALNGQVIQLFNEGKYAEATPIAEHALAMAERVLGRDHPDTLTSISYLGWFYHVQGRYADAEPLHRRALEASERILGTEHPHTLLAVNNLAMLYRAQSRYAEAEPLHKRALETSERALGAEHPQTLLGLNNLAAFYQAQGRVGEAEPLLQRGLETQKRVLGEEHPDTLMSVNNLASLYRAQIRYSDAEVLFKRALEVQERVLGRDHAETLLSINNLAELYLAMGRYGEAEPLLQRALEASERVLGSDHPGTLRCTNDLASLYYAQGRYREAEPLYQRALEGQERVLGKEHPQTLMSLSNLAALYHAQGQVDHAEPLYRRALETRERVLGNEHSDTLTSINNLAALYQAQGRYGEAEPLYRRALETQERTFGEAHPDTLISLNNLAALYRDQGRIEEAEPLIKRGLETRERVLGAEHPDTLISINNLAELYVAEGRYGEAEPLIKRALEATERVLGEEHPDTLFSVSNLARLHFAHGNWPRAVQFWRRSANLTVQRVRRGNTGSASIGNRRSEAELRAFRFWGLVKAAYRQAPEGRTPDSDAASSGDMFQTAQWALSSKAARSLLQMAARGASGDAELTTIIRERQDLVAEWQKRELLRTAALGQESAKRNAEAEAENNTRMAAIDTRIARIDTRLAAEFPDYAVLANPAPLSVAEVQAQLGVNEALVLFLDTPEAKPTPEETFIWVVTKTDVRWVRSDLGTAALTREVQALRCGLDQEEWATSSRAQRCADLLNLTELPSRPLPFPLGKAHALYKALFGEVEDLIRGKQLLIVPSGPLTQVPFQVLLTAPPNDGNYKSASWLASRHALTILPAVSSLKALRRTSRPSAAAKPFIGFGNPLLDGPDGRYALLASSARDKQSCGDLMLQRRSVLASMRRAVTPLAMQSGLADVSVIRSQTPLPETSDELCTVAWHIRADLSDLRLGARATEREVKAMSESGRLAQYRIVHFATHGAMTGELDKSSEPGLILTPPDTASEEDDGYLSASEIAALKLDADWVILSACNTAAGNATNAEALSGLARAFIYAQARALLVSHWAVDSNATVKLITSAMREIAGDRAVGRAEALRRAMLTLIDKGEAHEAHPAYWAPFIVVGEGAL